MNAKCHKCGWDDTVEYSDDAKKECRCFECGARYTVEPDYDWRDDHYVDCSTPGKEIVSAEVQA